MTSTLIEVPKDLDFPWNGEDLKREFFLATGIRVVEKSGDGKDGEDFIVQRTFDRWIQWAMIDASEGTFTRFDLAKLVIFSLAARKFKNLAQAQKILVERMQSNEPRWKQYWDSARSADVGTGTDSDTVETTAKATSNRKQV